MAQADDDVLDERGAGSTAEMSTYLCAPSSILTDGILHRSSLCVGSAAALSLDFAIRLFNFATAACVYVCLSIDFK